MSKPNIQVIKKSSKDVPIEHKKKLSNLFFYLQDVSQEIQAAFGIMQIVIATLDKNNSTGASVSELKQTFNITIVKANEQTIKSMAKICLQNTILNICRIGEAISFSEQLQKDYCPTSYNRFQRFKTKYYTNSTKQYRNKYSAHPLNKITDDFLTLDEIFKLVQDILNIKSMRDFNFSIVQDFISTLHHPSTTDPERSITWAISFMAEELKSNGVDVKREKPF